MGWEDDISDLINIKTHLGQFKTIMDDQVSRYEEKYPWFALHRPREQKIFESEKIINPQHAQQIVFAYLNEPIYSSRDVYYITPKNKKLHESLKFVCAILNSNIIKFWLKHKGKRKGFAYELKTTPLSKIPFRCIDFSNKKEIKTHDILVKKVEAMIETKKRLAEFNNFFKTRLTRLEEPKGIPEPDVYAITRTLPASDLRVLRTHPKVQIEAKDSDDFYLAKAGEIKGATLFDKSTEEAQYSMKLVGKNKKEIAITAPKEIIYYLKEILKDYLGKSLDEIKKIPLAKDLETYEAKRNEILKEVKKLLTKAKSLQAEIDEIVYELYGITQAERKIIEKELQS